MAEQFAALIEEVEVQKILDRALRLLEKRQFPLQAMEVIAQDEFSLDLVIPFPDQTNFLALGVT